MTDMVSNLCTMLTGECYGYEICGETGLNVPPKCTSGFPWNHKERAEKEKALSHLKYDIEKWVKEAIDGNCDGGCAFCHEKVTAYQDCLIEESELGFDYDGGR